ncbi:MAG: ABC transporter ATP-binding protein [Clostridia bacterium]|nr:ABC transporter ATP-binding protein [Clostridia bacterium]
MMRLENIGKTYAAAGRRIIALRNVCMSVEAGECIAITGGSGSGKSTLMNIMGCLDVQSCGEYYLCEENIKCKNDREKSLIRSKTIGFVFQSFNLLPSLTALENVELALSYQGVGRRQRKERAREALYVVGMGDREGHRPYQLSGGQQQRVAIARAIAQDPSVILADEPTGNLDPATGGEIVSILSTLNRKGKTVVLITHDMRIAYKADRMISIKNGEMA